MWMMWLLACRSLEVPTGAEPRPAPPVSSAPTERTEQPAPAPPVPVLPDAATPDSVVVRDCFGDDRRALVPLPDVPPLPPTTTVRPVPRVKRTPPPEPRAVPEPPSPSRRVSPRLQRQLEAMGYVAEDETTPAPPPAPRPPWQQQLTPRPLVGPSHSLPSPGWGATVTLSNDDSMSLASAQNLYDRLRQAGELLGLPASEGRDGALLRLQPQPSHIRPHELLNALRFDTAPPTPERLFSVLGAAERRDDVLTMSLAVAGHALSRDPLDLTLLVDRSASMKRQDRIDHAKRGLRRAADQLAPGDRVDVVLFDHEVCTPLQNYVVGRDDPRLLALTLEQIVPRGPSDLSPGLEEAYRLHDARTAREKAHRNQRLLLLTDGNVNVGKMQPGLLGAMTARFDDDRLRITAVGLGEANDRMLEALTERSKGSHVVVRSEAMADRVFGEGFDALTHTIAHDVQFHLELPDSLALRTFSGEEASTDPGEVQPVHYSAGTSQLFVLDLAVRPGPRDPDDPVRLRIDYRDAQTGEPAEEMFETTVGTLLAGDRDNLRKGRAAMAFGRVAMAWASGHPPCGRPLQTYLRAARQVPDDPELRYTTSLLANLCPDAYSERTSRTPR